MSHFSHSLSKAKSLNLLKRSKQVTSIHHFQISGQLVLHKCSSQCIASYLVCLLSFFPHSDWRAFSTGIILKDWYNRMRHMVDVKLNWDQDRKA